MKEVMVSGGGTNFHPRLIRIHCLLSTSIISLTIRRSHHLWPPSCLKQFFNRHIISIQCTSPPGSPQVMTAQTLASQAIPKTCPIPKDDRPILQKAMSRMHSCPLLIGTLLKSPIEGQVLRTLKMFPIYPMQD